MPTREDTRKRLLEAGHDEMAADRLLRDMESAGIFAAPDDVDEDVLIEAVDVPEDFVPYKETPPREFAAQKSELEAKKARRLELMADVPHDEAVVEAHREVGKYGYEGITTPEQREAFESGTEGAFSRKIDPYGKARVARFAAPESAKLARESTTRQKLMGLWNDDAQRTAMAEDTGIPTPELDAEIKGYEEQLAALPEDADDEAKVALETSLVDAAARRWTAKYPEDSGMADLLFAQWKATRWTPSVAQLAGQFLGPAGHIMASAFDVVEPTPTLGEIVSPTDEKEKREIAIRRKSGGERAAKEAEELLGVKLAPDIKTAKDALQAMLRPVYEAGEKGRIAPFGPVVVPGEMRSVSELGAAAKIAPEEELSEFYVPNWVGDLVDFTEPYVNPGALNIAVATGRITEEEASAAKTLQKAGTMHESIDMLTPLILQAQSKQEIAGEIESKSFFELGFNNPVEIDYPAVKTAIEADLDLPGFDSVRKRMVEGKPEKVIDRAIQHIPLSAFPEGTVKTGTLQDWQAYAKLRRMASEQTGGKFIEGSLGLLSQLAYQADPTDTTKGKSETTAGWFMRVPASIAPEAIGEINFNPWWIANPGLAFGKYVVPDAVLDVDRTGFTRLALNTLAEARLPTFAGYEHMRLSEGTLFSLVADAFNMNDFVPLRDPESNYFERIGGDIYAGNAGLFMHGSNILAAEGVDPTSGFARTIRALALVGDGLIDFEGGVARGIVSPSVRAARGYRTARLGALAGIPKTKGFAAGAAPEVVAFSMGLKDVDHPTVIRIMTEEYAARDHARGRDVRRRLPKAEREAVVEVARQAGVSETDLNKAYDRAIFAQRRRHIGNLKEIAADGSPRAQRLRKTKGYEKVREEMQKGVEAGWWSEDEAAMRMAALEVRAQHAVDAGKYKSLAAAFADQDFQVLATEGPSLGAPSRDLTVDLEAIRKTDDYESLRSDVFAGIDAGVLTKEQALAKMAEVERLAADAVGRGEFASLDEAFADIDFTDAVFHEVIGGAAGKKLYAMRGKKAVGQFEVVPDAVAAERAAMQERIRRSEEIAAMSDEEFQAQVDVFKSGAPRRSGPISLAPRPVPLPRDGKITIALTGYKAAGENIGRLWDESQQKLTRAVETKDADLYTAGLDQRDAFYAAWGAALSKVFEGLEPHFADPYRRSPSRGQGAAVFEGVVDVEPNIRLELRGDVDEIRARFAEFNEATGQDQGLMRVHRGVMPDGDVAALTMEDGRLATAAIKLPLDMYRKGNFAKVLDVLKNHGLGWTFADADGVLEIVHTPEWTKMDTAAHFDAVEGLLEYLVAWAERDKSGTIGTEWLREDVFVTEKTPRTTEGGRNVRSFAQEKSAGRGVPEGLEGGAGPARAPRLELEVEDRVGQRGGEAGAGERDVERGAEPLYQRMEADLADVEAGLDVDAERFGEVKGGATTGEFEAAGRMKTRIFKGADITTVEHEDWHYTAAVIERSRPDLFEKITDAFDSVNGQLTRKGHEQFAEAGLYYTRTGLAQNGRQRRMFDQIKMTFADVWYRARKDVRTLPRSVREMFDAEFRPDKILESEAMELGAAAKDFKTIIIPDELGELPAKETVRKEGRRAEAFRTKLSREELLQELGVKAGEQVPVHILVEKIVGYLRAEQARAMFGIGDLVSMTTRTVVPAARVARVRRETLELFADYMGTTPDKLTLKDDLIHLDLRQQLGLRRLASAVANEPMGNIVPDVFLDPKADLSTVRPVDWQYLHEAIVDTRAGVAARRSQAAEAVAPTVGFAAVKAVMSVPDMLVRAFEARVPKEYVDYLKQRFTLERPGEKYASPKVVELMETAGRAVGNVQAETLMRAAALTKGKKFKGDIGALISETLQELRQQLWQPVKPVNTAALLEFYTAFENPTASIKTLEELLSGDRLDTLYDILMDGKGATQSEKAAIVALDFFRDDPDALADFLAKDGNQEFANVLQHVRDGIGRRWRSIDTKAQELAVIFSGDPDSNIALGMTAKHKVQFYNAFFSGEWDALPELLAQIGRETGAEINRPVGFSQEVAVAEAVVRMRAHEILNELAEDLTRYGLTGALDELVPPEAILARDQFYEDVLHYINLAISWKDTKKVTIKGRPTFDVTPPTKDVRPPYPWAPRDAELPTGSLTGHNLHAYTTAHKLLNQWGFKMGKGEWGRFQFHDGSETLMPKMFADYLNEQLDKAAMIGRARGAKPSSSRDPGITMKIVEVGVDALVKSEATKFVPSAGVRARQTIGNSIDTVLTPFGAIATGIKLGLTVGPFIPNPAYFVTNFFGGGLQVYAKTGLKGISAPIRHADMVQAMVRRMYGDGLRAVGDAMHVTPDGRIFSADMLTDYAMKAGLKSSFVHAESARAMARDLKWMHHKRWQKAMTSPILWERQLIEINTALDNIWRVGTFLDALDEGKSLTAAAEVARIAGYDYSALTPFEKTIMRNLVLFYSYMSKNVALFWDTMLRNPHRLMGQLRLMKGLHEWYLEDTETTLNEAYDMRYDIAFRSADIDAARQQGYLTVAPVTPISDALNLHFDAFDILREDPQALRGIVSRVAPWAQLPFVTATNTELFFGRDLEDVANVPSSWVEMAYGMPFGYHLINTTFQVYPYNEPDPAKWENGSPTRYRAGNAKAWTIYRMMFGFVPWSGRSMDTITALDRANTGLVEFLVNQAQKQSGRTVQDVMGPRLGISESEELMGVAGFRTIPVASPAYAQERAKRKAMREMGEELKTYKPQ